MKRPTRVTCANKHRNILLRSVFFLCLLISFVGTVGMGKGRDGTPPKANTFSAEQGKETERKLIVSVRNSLDALPLENAFDAAHLGQGSVNDTKEEGSVNKKIGVPSPQVTESRPIRGEVSQQQVATRKESYRVTGVIHGDIPLVLLEGGGETNVYGVGEGPKGYRITSITAHEVWSEAGLLYRY